MAKNWGGIPVASETVSKPVVQAGVKKDPRDTFMKALEKQINLISDAINGKELVAEVKPGKTSGRLVVWWFAKNGKTYWKPRFGTGELPIPDATHYFEAGSLKDAKTQMETFLQLAHKGDG